MIFLLILAVLVGFLTACQGSTNSRLSEYTGNFQATMISFGVGTIILVVYALLFGEGDLTQLAHASWWQVIGGVYGVYSVLITTFAVPCLGLVLTLTAMMMGELTMSIVIDGLGLFGVTPVPISFMRILGSMVVFLGIVLGYIAKKNTDAKRTVISKSALMLVLAFVAGIGGAVQSATNASAAALIGSVEAAAISFVGGFVLIFIITLILYKGRLKPIRHVGISPWMLCGGLYGMVMIFGKIVSTPVLGVTLLAAAVMAGQLAGGMLIDSLGLFRTSRIKMNKWRYLSVLFIIAGIFCVTCAKMSAAG